LNSVALLMAEVVLVDLRRMVEVELVVHLRMAAAEPAARPQMAVVVLAKSKQILIRRTI
jgi:hypothetical protein